MHNLFVDSCVAVWKNGRVEVCQNEQGNRITPSYVAFSADGQRLVGDAAKNQAATNPENTIFDVKRLIGRKHSDSSVQKDAKLFPFSVVQGSGDKPMVKVKTGDESKILSPEEVSAMVSTCLEMPIFRSIHFITMQLLCIILRSCAR